MNHNTLFSILAIVKAEEKQYHPMIERAMGGVQFIADHLKNDDKLIQVTIENIKPL